MDLALSAEVKGTHHHTWHHLWISFVVSLHFTYLMCIGVLSACVCLVPAEGIGYPGTGVIDSCVALCVCRGPNPRFCGRATNAHHH